METSGDTPTIVISWGPSINPIVQVLEHYLNERKKHG